MNKALMLKQLQSIMSQNKSVLVIDSKEYDCTRTVLEAEKSYGFFGESDNYKFSVVASAADVSAVEIGTDCTVDGKAYRVLATGLDALGLGVTLHLGAALGQAR